MGGEIKKYENGEYDGDIIDGKREGKGTMTYNNRYVYEGEWMNDERHGQGKMTFSNVDVYEGEWNKGNINGRGIMKMRDGRVYDGEWKDNIINGQGKMTYSNGDVYEGEWKKGKRDGQGKKTYKNGDVSEGEWKDDIMNGQGKMSYKNGGVYEGQWRYGRKNGQGKLTSIDGNVYDGEWKDDIMKGQGKMSYNNGDVYEGQWKNGLKNGQGKMTYSNGDVYEGEWKNGKPYRQQGISNTIDLTISNTKYAKCLGKTAFEPIEGDVNVEVFIKDKGNLVFKLGEDSFYGINKAQIRPIYENNDETVYCCKEIGKSIVPRRENVDMDNPYFNMNKIGIPSGIVKRGYITKILGDTTNKLYELVNTEQKCVATTTGQMLGNNPIAVSADHCQEKSNKTVYELKIIKQETMDGEKYKKSSRKNKTKKSKTRKNP